VKQTNRSKNVLLKFHWMSMTNQKELEEEQKDRAYKVIAIKSKCS
jgi:hypothetical protein